MMKKGFLFLPAWFVATAFLIWTCPGCARPKSVEVIARIHFAGADGISKNTNSLAFQNEFSSPEARALENQTLDKLSHAPAVWFQDKLPAGVADGSAWLRPLLDDFLKSEWTLEICRTGDSPEYALAIRLNAARARLWQDNLRSLLESWTKISARNVTGGWELKKDEPPNLFRVVRAGDWLIIGCGQDDLPVSDAWATGNVPQNWDGWLNADLDWPRLAQLFPALAKFDFPAIHAQVTGVNGNLYVTGKLDLSQSLSALPKWQIPTNIIHPPLTSFTAARGFAPWLEKQSWAKSFELSPEPDQLFSWSLGLMPMQTFIAVPVPDATSALAQLDQNLTADTNWQKHLMSPFALKRAPNRIFLQHVPFAGPEVQALHETNGDFLFADVFPNLPRGKAPPPELFRAFDQSNLVFYHWEYTPARLKNLPQLTQLALLLTNHKQLQRTSAATKWLNRIGPTLGSCVTEVTQTGPSELSFVRKAPSGFTAPELIVLANWLEAPNFPGCDLSLPPPRQFIPIHRPVKKLAAPVQPTKH